MSQYILDIVIVVCLVASALWAVFSPRLLRAVIGLAVASICVSLSLFRMDAPMAAVFELSVCAGLISAVFISTISLSALETDQRIAQTRKERLKRYWFLPPLLVMGGVLISQVVLPAVPEVKTMGPVVRDVLWTDRRLDLFGQIIVLLSGAFGVVVLFKQRTAADDSAQDQAPSQEPQP